MTWITQTKEIVDLVITQEFIPSYVRTLTIREENMNYSIGLNHFEEEKKIKKYIKPEDIWEVASDDEIYVFNSENSWQVIHEEDKGKYFEEAKKKQKISQNHERRK